MPQSIRITLPIPPSINSMYRNVPGRGRVASKGLREWKEAAGWKLQAQPRQQFHGPFRIKLYLPQDMRGDVDGRLKAAIDLLVAHRVTPDDRFAQSVSSERSADVPPGECLIVVESAK